MRRRTVAPPVRGGSCAAPRSDRARSALHPSSQRLETARCADLPPRARESGQTGRGGRANTVRRAPLAGSDDAEARWAASGRSGGFAQSCGRRRSFDRGGPDPCSLHQQGSCGRFPCVSGRDPSAYLAVVRRGLAHSTSRSTYGKLSTEEMILTSAGTKLRLKNSGCQNFPLCNSAGKGKAQGQKAKGTEFEPRRSQNFLLKPLRPRAFSSRQGGEY